MVDSGDKKPFAWVETAGAILMAMSSLGTAWCSFEVSRWGAASSGSASTAAALERKANLMSIEGSQVQAIQVQMFMEYVAAHLSGNAALERFYVDRFPPEAKGAFDAWILQKPFENPAAPPHPFVPGLYERRHAREIEQDLRESARIGQEARTLGDVADRYLTNTVLLATVLFFFGMTTRFSSARLRLGTFCFGAVLFSFAMLRVVILPMRI
jgi:hypothetical protein